MNLVAHALCLALAQAPEADPASPPAPTAPTTAPGLGRPKGAEEVARIIAKIPSMPPAERQAALEALARQYAAAETNPVLPPDVDLERYLELDPARQAEVVARGFFVDLIGGDPGRLVARAGYPFFLEGRRFDRPEELRSQWGLSLRSRRADLLKLYGVEVLLPADMEKKYGKPPQRLSAWSWRSPNTYVAVGNLSGHAAVLLLRQAGATWQVVGFHD